MKKLESLGRSLSKDEQKMIMGGDVEVEDVGGGAGILCVHDWECPDNPPYTHKRCRNNVCVWSRVY